MITAAPCLPDGISALMVQIAVLLLILAGFCVMFGMKHLAPRLIFAGILLATAAAGVPFDQDWKAQGIPPLHELLTWAAVLGFCAAILGQPRLGALLAAPAFLLFFVWPTIAPALRGLPIWWLVIAAAIVVIVLGFRKLLPVQERAKVRIDSDSERVRDLLRNARSTTDPFRPPLSIDLPPLDKSQRTARKHFESTWP